MRKGVNALFFLLIVLIAFFLVWRYETADEGLYGILLSVATFLFGIFTAFYISDRHHRLVSIQEKLRAGDSNIIDLYLMSGVFGKKTQEEMREKLDLWLTKTIDYKLEDNALANPEFMDIYNYVLGLKPKSAKEVEIYSAMISTLRESSMQNKIIGYLTRDRLSGMEWVSMLGLTAIIVFCLYNLNEYGVATLTVSVLLVLTIIALQFLLYRLDTLRWKEQSWIWDPLFELFKELGKPAYIPEVIEKRMNIPKNMKYRSVNYKGEYPDVDQKVVVLKP